MLAHRGHGLGDGVEGRERLPSGRPPAFFAIAVPAAAMFDDVLPPRLRVGVPGGLGQPGDRVGAVPGPVPLLRSLRHRWRRAFRVRIVRIRILRVRVVLPAAGLLSVLRERDRGGQIAEPDLDPAGHGVPQRRPFRRERGERPERRDPRVLLPVGGRPRAALGVALRELGEGE